jgi:hypothetical protein
MASDARSQFGGGGGGSAERGSLADEKESRDMTSDVIREWER